MLSLDLWWNSCYDAFLLDIITKSINQCLFSSSFPFSRFPVDHVNIPDWTVYMFSHVRVLDCSPVAWKLAAVQKCSFPRCAGHVRSHCMRARAASIPEVFARRWTVIDVRLAEPGLELWAELQKVFALCWAAPWILRRELSILNYLDGSEQSTGWGVEGGGKCSNALQGSCRWPD